MLTKRQPLLPCAMHGKLSKWEGDRFAAFCRRLTNSENDFLIQARLLCAITRRSIFAHCAYQAHDATSNANLIIMPLWLVLTVRRPERIVPTNERHIRVPGMRHERLQPPTIDPLPAAFQSDETGRFTAGREQA